MNFVSYAFVFLFLSCFVARLTIGRTSKEPVYLGLLLSASLLFYGWHTPLYLLLLFTSVTIDYAAALLIDATTVPARRKLLLAVSMTCNLSLLFVFKYWNFAVDNLTFLSHWLHLDASWAPKSDLILPMGLSFYTFEAMSYTIDVYRGRLKPIRNYFDVLLFVSFFPHLVAGPIVRPGDFLPQIHRVRHLQWGVFWEGGYLIVRGFFLKMVIADNLGPIVDRFWPIATGPRGDVFMSVAVAALFGAQILSDFAGYSSIAQGTAYWLGFRLMQNFRYPYISCSFQEFWTRWHISLSQWLKSYLYIPLGGNRHGELMTYRNLLLVMLIGGLWHGASWTFVIWGLLHGIALVVERRFGVSQLEGPRRWLYWPVVQSWVLLTWVFFRARSVDEATGLLGNLTVLETSLNPVLIDALWLLIPLGFSHLRAALIDAGKAPPRSPQEKAFLAGIMIFAILTYYGQSSSFIYFQF
ncbi:MAG: alginate O-acetyltransferase [Candidatus Xenobia bacterium]